MKHRSKAKNWVEKHANIDYENNRKLNCYREKTRKIKKVVEIFMIGIIIILANFKLWAHSLELLSGELNQVPKPARNKINSNDDDDDDHKDDSGGLVGALVVNRGPRSLWIDRWKNGFGFTLRHFVVYPPESYMVMAKEKRLGLRQGNANLNEPMDTIFVKAVHEGTSAHAAGLETAPAGDNFQEENVFNSFLK
ncbi:hypothetical protein RUM43_013657 [Polyplax serrata]|uniref:Uncharacterized protein n=1 Tax=Polyplax serrata TaxID=468196 RepID=A0AAN8NR41_POLSC